MNAKQQNHICVPFWWQVISSSMINDSKLFSTWQGGKGGVEFQYFLWISSDDDNDNHKHCSKAHYRNMVMPGCLTRRKTTSLLPVHGLRCARMLQYGALVLLHMNAYAFTIGHIQICVCHCFKVQTGIQTIYLATNCHPNITASLSTTWLFY
jgi:hypothetical protein